MQGFVPQIILFWKRLCAGGTPTIWFPGGFYTCQAELLAYLDAYGGRLYIMDWGYLKELANHSQIGYRKNFWESSGPQQHWTNTHYSN